VGGSGCGKSTLLNMIAGLETVSEGQIMIGDRCVNDVAPKERDIAMVFQSYALYPTMTVRENISFGLGIRKVPKAEQKQIVDRVATTLQITHLLDRKPALLSGGQRQRVAMGRAIARDPSLFLFDEPLSNLDAKLRVSTRSQIAALQKRLGTTTVYVTHDQVEAMTMGHRVAVLKDGKLQQIAAPRELYDDPVNTFVAGFIGSPGMNLLTAPVRDGAAELNDLRIPVPHSVSGDQVVVGIRPESWEVTTDPENSLAVEVELLEELGSESFLYSHGVDDEWSSRTGRIVARVDRRFQVALGDRLRLAPKQEEVFFFDAVSELRVW
ncbi:MAG: ugpC, partial [Nocardia sp.]|uniref:ABC transporter ATP-binding protein n=1 Tax=Nocardia sp. TaxID=1821 RepID=UPI00262431F7